MLLLLLLALASPPPTPERPNLSGRWTFNAEKSDDVRAKLQTAQPPRAPDPGGRRRRGSYGPAPNPPPQNWGALADAPRTLTITQTQDEVTILDSDGRLLQLHPDQAPATSDEPRSTWQDQLLVVETRDGGLKTTQAYGLKDGALTVSVTLAGPGSRSPTAKRVYDRPAP